MPRKKVNARDQGSEFCLEGTGLKEPEESVRETSASPLGRGKGWSRCWRQTPNWELPPARLAAIHPPGELLEKSAVQLTAFGKEGEAGE